MRHRLTPLLSLAGLLLLISGCDDGAARPDAQAIPTQPTAGAAPAQAPAWRLDAATVAKGRLPTGGAWSTRADGEPVFRLSVPAERSNGQNLWRVPVDLRPYRDCQIYFSATVRAEGVSKPPATYNGIKVMLHWASPTGGEHWVNPRGLHGTFDWQTAGISLGVEGDAEGGDLSLGLQDSHGTVEIAEVQIQVMGRKPARPAPRADAGPAYRGHDLPRLRGVMSPHQYKPDDFAELERWNVNAVRWQITRQWGQAGTDRDLAEYDTWLEGKLAQLDLALADAAKRGIRLVIDLHSPPGGRYPDRSMAMFYEQAYQDHFVAVWERIARRYRGNPAVWAYDLVNEPVQGKPSPAGLGDWYGLQVKAAKAIRAIDPATAISIEVDEWDNPRRFAWLTPVDLPNIIYQVHMYEPGEFTHQGVHNAWGEGSGQQAVTYPGTVNKRTIDREALRAFLKPVREFQLAYNAHIYVGEFSAIRWAPGADRYLADCIDLFEEYGWDWTYHAFREWGGWSVEHEDLPYDKDRHTLAPADRPTARATVLRSWFARNERRPFAP